MMKNKLGYDDSLDVFPVHGVGGMLGTVLTGVFVAQSLGGKGLAGVTMAAQITTQIIGAVTTVLWCAMLTLLILKLVDRITGLRVASESETQGLDLTEHGERGYIL